MLNEIANRAFANKKAKGFPLYDFQGDVKRMMVELDELKNAPYEERGSELADIIIYCAAIAEYSNIDLEKAVLAKMLKIEKRVITIDESGKFSKEEGK